MAQQKDSPGIHLPPPLIYVVVFFFAWFIQKEIPIDNIVFHKTYMKIIGAALLAFTAVFFLYRSLWQFFKTRNTVITFKPANSLQTTGIYSITRNPMYVGLTFAYLGITCFVGNWWCLILLPLLIILVRELIIKKEEKYLERRFGQSYIDYKKKVRRWL